MQHDDSEDEFGFWETAGRRPSRRAVPSSPRRGAGSDGRDSRVGPPTDEPTRQLQRIEPFDPTRHTGEMRRLRVSGSPDPRPGRSGRRFGRAAAGLRDGSDGIAPFAADEALYLDSDLTDEHYFDSDPANGFRPSGGVADTGQIAVVPLAAGRRAAWRTLLARDSRGRFDPIVTRVGAIVLVGVLAVPFALATNSTADAPSGATAAATRPANVAVVGAPVTTMAPPAAVSSVGEAPAAAVTSLAAATSVASSSKAPAAVHSAAVAATAAASPTPTPASAPASSAAQSGAPSGIAASGATPSASGSARSAAAGEQALSATVDTPTAPAASACGPSYTIQSGDYWIGIAKRADVTLADLLHANAAAPATALYPGITICLPVGTAALPAATRVTTTTTSPPATTAPAPATTAAPTTTPPRTAPPTTTPPTTAPPTTAPPRTTPPTTSPPRTYTRAQVEQIIRDTWPDDQEDKAVAIATRESNLNPAVRNYCCYGLFQIYYDVHRTWLNQMGVTNPDQLFDPAVNALAALVLYNRSGGWGPWAL